MFKNRILKKISAGLMAGLCAFTLIGTNLGGLKTNAAETAKEPLLSGDEVIRQAATYLGVPYGWDCKGYDGVYSSSNPTKQSMETVRRKGLDCSGLVYATLTDLGVSTAGFPSNNPVPQNYWEYADGSAYKNCTMTYKGVTAPIEVIYEKLDADSHQYYENENLIPGAVISGVAKDNGIGHMWFYMGQFDSRDAVLDYLVKLGYNRDAVSPYVGSGNGDGGKHWRIECNGSQGCVINNNTDGKARFASFVAYKITSRDITFSIKKCIDGTSQIVGKSPVDGSTAKYGVYSDSACKTKVGEITIGADGTGSIKLPGGTYYVKEIKAPTGYALSTKVYELKANQTVTVYEDFQVGKIKVNKTSEDDIVKDIEFKVIGSDGSSYTRKTNSSGVAEFSGLKVYDMKTGKAVTYTVSEINVATRYETPKAKNVTLTSGNADLTVNVNFDNDLKKGSIKINKQSEDGENGDRTFEIKGGGKTYTIKTGSDGIAILSDIPVYDSSNKKIVYTISEKNVPVKYVVPADQTATLTADATVNISFKNVLKKFTVEVTKQDAEMVSAQGNATLAGAVYGLYLDGKLADTYTTDSDGYFKTKEYVCGNYTLQEISPSEGYLLDETVYPVGAEAKNYTIEHNPISMIVTEDVIKGKISIIKHTDDGTTQIETPEAGAEFQVYLKSSGSYENAKSSEKDYLICDENGFAETKLLPYGVYTVHQTKGWEGTEFMSDFDVNISDNGQTYRYLINNAEFESYVKVVKVDSETGKTIPYEGAGFEIYDSNGQKISMTFSYPTPTTIDVFYTNNEGYLITPEVLSYGEYSLVEVQAPYGYVLDSTPVAFSISADNSEEENALIIVKVEKKNTPQKGKISIQKTGDIFSSVTALGSAIYIDENGEIHESGQTTYTPVFEESGLANAVYQVIASEDIVTADGTIRANAGNVVAELATNENGYAETDLLYLGKYEVKEITAPYGYVLNGEPQLVELTYAGQEVTVRDTVNTAFVNDYQKLEISLSKVMEQDETFGIGMNSEYKNVRFGLFAAEEITAADGNAIPENGFIAEVSLDENMKAVIAEKVPFAKYYVQEIATDEHYVLNGEKYLVSFEYQGQEMTTVYVDCGQFENNLKRGKIKGLKVNESEEPLENALFGLFAMDCKEFTADNAIVTSESDSKGEFEFSEIPVGSYIVHEIEAPTGYILSDESYPVTVCEDGEIIEITAENVKIRGNVTITKIDEEYLDNKLSGAEFTVYSDEKYENKIGVLTETEKGVYVLENLEYGQYFLKETIAPDGFILDENVYPFSIEKDSETVEISNAENGKGFINKPKRGSVEITKTDISTGQLIPNCGIEILDKDGNVVIQGRTDDKGIMTFDMLRVGDYFYREFDAPDGYILDENSYPFTIKENGEIVKCSMTNTKIPHQPTPYTGDNGSDLLAWIMIGFSLAIGSVLFIIRKKKGGKHEE
ncbi:SpaA isopeptide-forming pilin-related protein [Porcipelethomonas ammoniilytica]|uniref:MSCRAMM family protein n=1 Tax=Porcipelethomonas ammoniilytica TaxID=2981722 RepID=UPI000821466E|nr:SpaA isopeptide-forming pilin-related protein [Porcipelethomonas ammoniilytica]MCU6720175.1 SpaA isopeptide-forming pilin-related protein [Porcipelethomonas ammoniilytica]SCJ04264.1 Predicted outer membrane protein [uncultured Ruminococcus sp.]